MLNGGLLALYVDTAIERYAVRCIRLAAARQRSEVCDVSLKNQVGGLTLSHRSGPVTTARVPGLFNASLQPSNLAPR